jgi:aminoglycoside 3-N-acetyltransferase
MSWKDPLKRMVPPRLLVYRRRARAWILGLQSRAFSQSELVDALASLGITPGDTLFVHSSAQALSGMREPLDQLPGALMNLLGPEGLLAMPAFSYRSLPLTHAQSDPLFDVLRTPARSGLLNELFRRMPGVQRSLHPTHSVCAAGKDAKWFTTGHECGETPFHEESPFAKLHARFGKIVFVGVDALRHLTQMHYAEDSLGDRFGARLYWPEAFLMRVRDEAGRERVLRSRVHDPEQFVAMNHKMLELTIRQIGGLRETRVAHVPMAVVDARSVYDAVERLADQGRTIYRCAERARDSTRSTNVGRGV